MNIKKILAVLMAMMMLMASGGVYALADEVRVTNDAELRTAVVNALAANDGTTILLSEGEYSGLGITYSESRGADINFKGEGNVIKKVNITAVILTFLY